MNNASQGWSEYWEQEGAGGEVFVDPQGRKHPALGGFWSSVFEGRAEGSRVIDIASGAGSIYGHLPADHGLSLSAADISREALAALSERISGVKTLECPADEVPADDQSYDVVVSQFGIEYAGVDAFGEAARLVAPGGCFAALVHRRDGYIDSRNKAELCEAKLVLETGFIDRCRELVAAAYSDDPVRMRAAETAFVPAAKEIDTAVKRCSRGVHAYLLAGFGQLFENRRQYDRSDIDAWLEGMRGEVDKAVMRLAHMRTAALSADDIDRIRSLFDDAGFVDIDAQEFFTPGNDKAVAWQLRAERPGS